MRHSRRWRVRNPQGDGSSLQPNSPQSQHAASRQLGDGVASAQQASPCQGCRLQRFVGGLRKPSIPSNRIRCGPNQPRRTVETGCDSECADARTTTGVTALREGPNAPQNKAVGREAASWGWCVLGVRGRLLRLNADKASSSVEFVRTVKSDSFRDLATYAKRPASQGLL